MFDRSICRGEENKVIECQKKYLTKPNAEIIDRLKAGMKIAKKRRDELEKKLIDQHTGSKGKQMIGSKEEIGNLQGLTENLPK